MRHVGVLVFVCLLVASAARAQQPLDDRIDGPPPPVAPDVVTRDAQGHATTEKTEVWNLYVSARNWESDPAKRVTTGSQRPVSGTFTLTRGGFYGGTLSINVFDTPWGKGESPRMFASALVQYASSTHWVSTNARFRWEYQPGSELFVVYSDGRGTTGQGFPALENRSVVVKVTRLFRW